MAKARGTAAPRGKLGQIFLPQGSARYSDLVVARPLLLVVYHIEKTAGSAMMKWLAKQLQPPARLTALYTFTQTTCFFASYPELFPQYIKAWDSRRCVKAGPIDWRTAAIAIEFHAYTKYRYWKELAPSLPSLRAKYAELDGTVVTTAAVREPMSHIVSAYHMWPPVVRREGIKHAVPFPQWLRAAEGLQVGSLSLDSKQLPSLGWHNPHGCKRFPLALQRLSSFDSVGVLECTGLSMRLIGTRLGWDLDARLHSALERGLRHRPNGVNPGGLLWVESRAWQLDSLDEMRLQLLNRTANCDRQLYLQGVRQLRAELHSPLGAPTLQNFSAEAVLLVRSGSGQGSKLAADCMRAIGTAV